MEHAIACTNVRKKLGSFSLDLENFCVQKGTVHGLIGANGSGKTTTIKLLLGLMKQDEGDISVLSSSAIAQDADTRNRIGFIVDDASVPSMLNPKEMGAVLSHVYSEWDATAYSKLLTQFKLDQKKPYRSCSRGMKVKVLLAIALSHKASLLILDEPTSGLDPLSRDEILSLLSDYSKDEEHTIFITSHITSDLEKLCDYITVLDDGKVRLTEEKDALLDSYRLVRTTHSGLSDFDPEAIIAKREGEFQIELLMHKEQIPTFAEPIRITLEELVIMLAKGGYRT
jgi:ABC-2 type transport system ATP-binding protein